MAALPPRLVRRRIAIQIEDHLDWLAGLYAERGWDLGPATREPAQARPEEVQAWSTRDLSVAYARLTPDGRPAELHVAWRNVPSVVAREADEPRLGFEHAYAVVLPAAYPSSMQMRFVNLTPTLHPRMLPPDREAPACIFPNADLDLTLRELLWNLLFRPDMVRPPELFDAEDAGFRPTEMAWYSRYGPQRLHEELLAAWDARQRERAAAEQPRSQAGTGPTAAPAEPTAETGTGPGAGPGFRILDEPDGDTPPPAFRVLDDA